MGDTATGSWTSRDLAAHQMNRRCEWNCPTCLKDWNCYCQGPSLRGVRELQETLQVRGAQPMNQYVYIQSEPGLWTVGFYRPDGKWEPESDHDSREAAANRVHWLNGGAK